MNVGFVHLGCSKNLIDTEVTIGEFKNHNYKIVSNPEEADIIVINTCGFIESAKEEAINTILEMAEYKKKRCNYLIVMGCLVQRYYDDLIKELPEVDLFIKLDEYDKLWDKISKLVENNIVERATTKTYTKISEVPEMPMLKQPEFLNRTITTGKNFAYIKIGEGCSNRCTYCAIPYIRGPFVSRPKENIIEEAKKLASEGITELIIVAQDTTKYGEDIYGESKLPELLQDLCDIKGIKWVRFLYSYPEGITDELIDVVANNEKIANYFDIPIQHISDSVLKRMNRRTSKKDVTQLITKIRNKIPDVTLRTTLIVGFPGETEDDFSELMEFIKWAKFDKLGVFQYSKEEGTPAEKLPDQINGNTKKSRYNKIMSEQQKISKKLLEEKIGKTYEVIIERKSFDGKYYIGRTKQDVPDIDGLVYIKNDDESMVERIIDTYKMCTIKKVSNYDLIAVFDKLREVENPEEILDTMRKLKLDREAYLKQKNLGEQLIIDVKYLGLVELDGNQIQIYDLLEGIMKNGNITLIDRFYTKDGEYLAGNNREDEYDYLILDSKYIENKTLEAELRKLERNGAKFELEKMERERETEIAYALNIQKEQIKSITEIDANKELIMDKDKSVDQNRKIQNPTKDPQTLSKQEVDDLTLKTEVRSNQRVTDLETMASVLNVEDKGYTKIAVVNTDSIENNKNSTRFTMIGIKADGTAEKIDTVQERYGTNPTKRIQSYNRDGTKLENEQVNSIYQVKGESEKQISIKIGPTGTTEIDYVRTPTQDNQKAISVPIETKAIRHTTTEVRQLMNDERNPRVKEELRRIDMHKKYEDNPTVKDIDDNKYNDTHKHENEEEIER